MTKPSDSMLRMARKARDLTLEQMAARIGVTAGQLSRIEVDGRTSFDTAKKIMVETGLTMEQIAAGAPKVGAAA